MSDVAAQCLRVIKPGGHALVWALPRTSHWTATAWEDAGWDVRDRVIHIFGSGFPKSHNISVAIDKAAGVERGSTPDFRNGPNTKPTKGDKYSGGYDGQINVDQGPTTEAAKQWDGWGTALKPAAEDWWLLRKPLIGTVAQNVLTHGVGGLNIDACRVETSDTLGGGMVSMGRPKWSEGWDRPWMHDPEVTERKKGESADKVAKAEALGRYPANVTHDGSEEVLAGFPSEAGAAAPVHKRGSDKFRHSYGTFAGNVDEKGSTFQGDSGSASRFFYCAKGSSDDRVGSKHPTVKNLDLMQWLIRLVTPRGGTVLDCFAGSGTTGEAAWREGMKAILIEREPEYQADIARRMELAVQPTKRAAVAKTKNKLDNPNELPLFSTEKEKPL
jgi:hypothetical protein